MLAAEHPAWDVPAVEARVGVQQRHIARDDETALDLGLAACRALFARHPELPPQVDGVIFCTQSPDHIMPPNACLLHDRLQLSEQVLAFDLNHACSGFVYALALAKGLLATQQCRHVLIVTADTYSKYIHPGDRAVRMLFGDGAAATWVSHDPDALCDVACATAGNGHAQFMIPAGACRLPKSAATAQSITDASGNVRTPEHIHMDGMGVYAFVQQKVPPQILAVLARNHCTVGDVQLFCFHQASRLVLDALTRLLQLKPDRVFCNLENIGNTVSASIPIALKDALDAGRVSRGELVLLSGFGVGLSWATALVRL